MVDRVALMSVVEERCAPTETQRIAIRKHLDKALGAMVVVLPLNQAQGLSAGEREELGYFIETSVSASDLKKLAKLWEPARAIDAANQRTLVRDLLDLLAREREPYEKISHTLVEAQALQGQPRSATAAKLERLAPLKDLTALAKKWDKHTPVPKSWSRREVADHLMALLAGDKEPAAPPPPPPKKPKSSAKKTAPAREAA